MNSEKLLDNGYCYEGGKIHLTELTDEKIRLMSDLFEIEQKFRRIAVSNLDFRYLITFAVDPAKLGFGNTELSIEKFISWFKKQEKKKGLKFLIFPNCYISSVDGRPRLHFHGLINDRIELSECCRKKEFPIYAASEWKYGFSQVVLITDCYLKAVTYLTKELISFENCLINKPYFHSEKLSTFFNEKCFIELLNRSSEVLDNETAKDWLKAVRHL